VSSAESSFWDIANGFNVTVETEHNTVYWCLLLFIIGRKTTHIVACHMTLQARW
jgi:hypothetical protein